MESKQAKGKTGEDIALKLLEGKGYKLIERNYRVREGEIDLIMLQGETLVIVEVKKRSGARYGLGREAVNITKQKHMISATQRYIEQNNITDTQIRFDVVEIMSGSNITHIENAFDAF